MIPGLESAPEYDRSMILKFVTSDSGSGSFQVDPLESAPVLVSAPLVHCWSFLNQAEPVISYFDVPKSKLINLLKFDKYWLKPHCLDCCCLFYCQIYLWMEPIPHPEPIPLWSRLRLFCPNCDSDSGIGN